jgi:hypothetical protein
MFALHSGDINGPIHVVSSAGNAFPFELDRHKSENWAGLNTDLKISQLFYGSCKCDESARVSMWPTIVNDLVLGMTKHIGIGQHSCPNRVIMTSLDFRCQFFQFVMLTRLFCFLQPRESFDGESCLAAATRQPRSNRVVAVGCWCSCQDNPRRRWRW